MRYFLFTFALVISFAPLTTHAAFEFVQIVPAECRCDSVAIEGSTEMSPSAPAFGCVLGALQNVIRVAIALGIVVATLALIYAGFIWMTSGGKPERRNQGSHLLLNVFIGLFVMLGAWLLVDFVMKAVYSEEKSGFGPWHDILGPKGDSANYCLVVRKPTPIATGVVGLVKDIVKGPPSGTGAPGGGTTVTSRNLTHAGAAAILQRAGVEIKPGASLQGTTENAVNQVVALKQACGCSITVTSGTDGTHESGVISHGTGYKVDLRLNDALNSYLQSLTPGGSRRNGDRIYKDSCGNEYTRESDHWDITVQYGVCSLPRKS